MTHRLTGKSFLLYGTALSCLPFFYSFTGNEALAKPHVARHHVSVFEQDPYDNAYYLRRQQIRAKNYEEIRLADQAPEVPEPEIVENRSSKPYKVTIPNINQAKAADTADQDVVIVYRGTEGYHYLNQEMQDDEDAAATGSKVAAADAHKGKEDTMPLLAALRPLLAAISPEESKDDEPPKEASAKEAVNNVEVAALNEAPSIALPWKQESALAPQPVNTFAENNMPKENKKESADNAKAAGSARGVNAPTVTAKNTNGKIPLFPEAENLKTGETKTETPPETKEAEADEFQEDITEKYSVNSKRLEGEVAVQYTPLPWAGQTQWSKELNELTAAKTVVAENSSSTASSTPKTEFAQTPKPQAGEVEIAAATEPAQPAPLPWTEAPKAAQEQPLSYKSPGIIIKKEVVQLTPSSDTFASATPEQLAALAPSAGGAENTTKPLIQLIEDTEGAVSAEETKPVPATEAAAQPQVPAVTSPEQQPNVEKSIQDILPIADQTIPALQSETPPPMSSKDTAPAISTPEELPSLSPKSKKILKDLPHLADEIPKEPNGLTIDRAKATPNIFEAAPKEENVTHEAEGIKIEVKAPSLNINYELEKAYSALLSGNSEAAMGIYKSVLENDPDNVDAMFGLATTYHRAGQIDNARPLYGKILAKQPGHREALNNFLVLLADEAPEEALTHLEKLEKKNPSFSPIPAQIAVIHQKTGNLAKASEAMFKAVALAPENLTYRYNLAIILDKQKNFDEAARLYQQIIQANSRGEVTPGNINKIQERLTFLRSNRH